MTKKKMRFKVAKEFRRLGVPFMTARSMANRWVSHPGVLDDMPGVLTNLLTPQGCGCCDVHAYSVVTPKGLLVLTKDDLVEATKLALVKPAA